MSCSARPSHECAGCEGRWCRSRPTSASSLGYFSTWMTLDVSVACAKRGTYGGRIRRPRSACVMNTSRRQGVNTATCIAIGYGIQLMLLHSVGVL